MQTSKSSGNASLPLLGLRVVEFTHMVMGPTCGMVLADMGAEVIKVEPIEGDRTRHLRLTSVYLADSTCPQADGINMEIAQTLAQELREEGRVPFVVGGDWNCEPETGQCWWTGPGKLVAPREATTRFPKTTFDKFVVGAGLRQATAAANPEWVVEGHRGVTLHASGWQGNQLGRRQMPPRPVDLKRPPGEAGLDQTRIESEADYLSWTYQADRWLVRAYGDPQQKGAVRGYAPRMVDDTLGAPRISASGREPS